MNKLDRQLQSFVESDPPPMRDRLSTKDEREIRKALAWYKRAWRWLVDMQKGVPVIAGLIVAGTGVNVWIHGLVSRTELDQAVGAAVERAMVKVMLDRDLRLAAIESKTSDLPAWRGAITVEVAEHDKKLSIVEKTANHSEAQLDLMFVHGGRGR